MKKLITALIIICIAAICTAMFSGCSYADFKDTVDGWVDDILGGDDVGGDEIPTAIRLDKINLIF